MQHNQETRKKKITQSRNHRSKKIKIKVKISQTHKMLEDSDQNQILNREITKKKKMDDGRGGERLILDYRLRNWEWQMMEFQPIGENRST